MDTFEKLILGLKGKLKEAKSGDKPSLFTEKVKYVYNLVTGYRKRLESIEKNMKKYLDERKKIVDTKKEEVLKGFVQSMSISKTDILTLIDKGWNYIASGDYPQAEKVLEVALKKSPDNVEVMKLLGWAYMYTERYDDALFLYQKVLSIQPNDAMARNNLGYICYKRKIFGEAIEHLSKVIKSGREASTSLYANYYLGLIYFEREMYNDAINFFGRALEIGPNLFEAKYYLALSYYKKGRVNKAMEIWKEMVGANPNNRWSQLAKKKLSGENQNNK
ncbi:MAG: tetratricopeptide repeat protein [Candidatus Cloacimonadota bacterium]|nr:MAG: tetratricopeptide repeat protein [Candidatus Cloacimonadota bacterium]